MNIPKINTTSFNGLLTISGPDKKNEVIVNTKAISTINTLSYLGEKEGSLLGIGNNEGAVLTMNNGTSVRTFLPSEKVVEAYKQAEANGEAKLVTKYNSAIEKPLLAF